MITIDYTDTVSKIINSSDIKDQLMLLHELIIAARSGDQVASREVDRIIKTLKTQPKNSSSFWPTIE